MKKTQIYKGDSTPWRTIKSRQPADQGSAATRERHPGGEDEVQLFDVKFDPNRQTEVHAHEQDEIVYVVAGQMLFGQHSLNPGDSIHIPAMTLYSFRAGPQGLQFINFRPRKDVTYYNRAEFGELQKLEAGARAEYREQIIRAARERVGWEDR